MAKCVKLINKYKQKKKYIKNNKISCLTIKSGAMKQQRVIVQKLASTRSVGNWNLTKYLCMLIYT